jgi:hypothetical protein
MKMSGELHAPAALSLGNNHDTRTIWGSHSGCYEEFLGYNAV